MKLKEIAQRLFEEGVYKSSESGERVQMGTRIHNNLEKAMLHGASFKQACAMFDLPEPEDGSEILNTVTGRVRSEKSNLMEIAKPIITPGFDALEQEVLGHEKPVNNEALYIPFNDLEVRALGDDSNEPPLLSVRVPRVPSALADIDTMKTRILASLGIPEEFFNERYRPVPKLPPLTSPRELAMSPCIGGGMAKNHPVSFTPRPSSEPKCTKADGTFTIHEESANTDGARERLAYAKEMFRKYLPSMQHDKDCELELQMTRALNEKRLELRLVQTEQGVLRVLATDTLKRSDLHVCLQVHVTAGSRVDAWEVLIEGLSR